MSCHITEALANLPTRRLLRHLKNEPSKGAYGTRRNEALWNQIVKPPDISFDAVTNYHSQWQAARTTTGSNQTPPALDQVIKWSPPPQNYIKCNLNAAGITD
ncbi:hypothetical protein glysoja_036996 [Glycine soja]|uniref:Uncharacterized protein n=1 Tax=Glycine soja TaxID=3848 RepID=A0A0B2SET2_GLYSO|nr:hypothetical protein JHK87_004721 [Glycine soja]KAG5080834.1 hypothetical protein JHK86_004899 [Glycine max]KHN42822.1 hypothetical protein glysoja_036996 [Glycine soja]